MKRLVDVECPRCRGTGDAWDEEVEAGRLTCIRCGGEGTLRALVVVEEEEK